MTPQTGIFALGTASHGYLELDLVPGADPAAAVAHVSGLREPRTTIGGVNLVAGFRPELWATVAPGRSPAGLAGFNDPIVGSDGYTLPATQHDVVIWLTGASYDVVFDLSRSVITALGGDASLVHETVGWPYHHDLDLTGFIDGTENPTLVEAASVALIPAGSPGEGGSILLLQLWEHDAIAWGGLSVEAQESVIGRREDRTAPSSTRGRRPRTSAARTRIGSGRSSAATSPTERWTATERSSSGSAPSRGSWPGCSTAWSDGRRSARRADALHPPADRRLLLHPVGRGPRRGRQGRPDPRPR